METIIIIANLVLVLLTTLVMLYVLYNSFFNIYYHLNIAKLKNVTNEIELRTNNMIILVPAHNEEKIIEKLIHSYKEIEYQKDKFDILIIADNCTDSTEKIAKDNNINCIVRNDNKFRGKPYALEYAIQNIEIDNYDAFCIIDADTIIDKHFLLEMNNSINQGNEAIQGFFSVMNPEDSWLTRIMTIPGVIKFKIRYNCKNLLNLSCPLMGNGMCFTRAVIKKYGWNAYSITENWEYYIKLALKGQMVRYNEKAIIYSHAVNKMKYGETQRKRWLKGRLGLTSKYLGQIIIKLIKKRDIKMLDVLIELTMPSYSMLLNANLLILLLSILSLKIGISSIVIVYWCSFLIMLQGVIYFNCLIIAKANLRTWISLLYIPIFLVWKITITIKAIAEFKSKDWEKTKRRL